MTNKMHAVHCEQCETDKFFEDKTDAQVEETTHYADTGHNVEHVNLKEIAEI